VNSSVIFENDGCVHSDNWLILAIHSLQPKTVIAFQWVKLDDVKLAHEKTCRIKSYWTKVLALTTYLFQVYIAHMLVLNLLASLLLIPLQGGADSAKAT
jgi:hypothetical protein